ncbi:MAG: hypothetical protein PUE12_15585 [Oscillospiraceae bacterium]|nr:hypothetical protein [Oscillospiraceae bacterium]
MATAVCSRISSTRKIKIFRFDNTAQTVEVHRQNPTAQTVEVHRQNPTAQTVEVHRQNLTAQTVEVHRQNLTAQPSVCRINCSLTGRRIKRFELPKIVRTIKSPVISELISQLDQYRPSLP